MTLYELTKTPTDSSWMLVTPSQFEAVLWCFAGLTALALLGVLATTRTSRGGYLVFAAAVPLCLLGLSAFYANWFFLLFLQLMPFEEGMASVWADAMLRMTRSLLVAFGPGLLGVWAGVCLLLWPRTAPAGRSLHSPEDL